MDRRLNFDDRLDAALALLTGKTLSDWGIEPIHVAMAHAYCSRHGEFSAELVIDGQASWDGGLKCERCYAFDKTKRVCSITAIENLR